MMIMSILCLLDGFVFVVGEGIGEDLNIIFLRDSGYCREKCNFKGESGSVQSITEFVIYL